MGKGRGFSALKKHRGLGRQDHWKCICGIENHESREKCLGCEKPNPGKLNISEE